jgi:hypothetical protein
VLVGYFHSLPPSAVFVSAKEDEAGGQFVTKEGKFALVAARFSLRPYTN